MTNLKETQMTERDLKPCPFCGGTEIFIEPDEWGSGGQWVTPIHVGCVECKAEQVEELEELAIAAWNRRSGTSAELMVQKTPAAWGVAYEDLFGVFVTEAEAKDAAFWHEGSLIIPLYRNDAAIAKATGGAS